MRQALAIQSRLAIRSASLGLPSAGILNMHQHAGPDRPLPLSKCVTHVLHYFSAWLKTHFACGELSSTQTLHLSCRWKLFFGAGSRATPFVAHSLKLLRHFLGIQLEERCLVSRCRPGRATEKSLSCPSASPADRRDALACRDGY